MKNHLLLFRHSMILAIVILCLFLTGCSRHLPQMTSDDLSYKPLQFKNATKVVAVVERVLNKEQIQKGIELFRIKFPPLHLELMDMHSEVSNIDKWRVAIVSHSTYWNNNFSKQNWVNGLKWVSISEDVEVKPGDLVEIEIIGGIGNIYIVKYEKGIHACGLEHYDKNAILDTVDVLFMLSGMPGGGNSASLVCPEIESEGWEKKKSGRYNEYMLYKQPNPQE